MEQLGNDNKQIMVPYVVYESMLAKEDGQQKRMSVIIILLIVLLVVTNAIWLVAWNQYDYVDEEVTTDISAEQGGNGVNIIGARDVDYGTESNNTNSTENTDKSTQ